MLEQTCRQLRQWRDADLGGPLYAGVKFSPRQLLEPAVLRDILGVLDLTGVALR